LHWQIGRETADCRVNHWLLKSEPDVFSFQHLKARPKRTEPWNGVRNYQVRNMMRDDMKPGDLGLFYHSSCEVPGVAGVVRIASGARPDPTQFDPKSEYYDKGSTKENPRWLLIDVVWEADLARFVPLEELRSEPRLAELLILRRGTRLSITPVSKRDFELICRMGGR
jgi:predicted RNA-binding protein with PUA-like domain